MICNNPTKKQIGQPWAENFPLFSSLSQRHCMNQLKIFTTNSLQDTDLDQHILSLLLCSLCSMCNIYRHLVLLKVMSHLRSTTTTISGCSDVFPFDISKKLCCKIENLKMEKPKDGVLPWQKPPTYFADLNVTVE